MGMRKYIREIAKERLTAMGMQKVNKHFGTAYSKGAVDRLVRTRRGRRIVEQVKNIDPPMWRKVTTGKLAKDGFVSQMRKGVYDARKREFAKNLKPVNKPVWA